MVKGVLLLRAIVIRYLLPPRPHFLASRRTPTKACNDKDRGALYNPRFTSYNDTTLGCMSYNRGYRTEELGTSACPAGRLMHDLPSYTGKGGGGSDAW
ncbi:unnamed protein product [Ascophyllum nodosum]